MSFLIYLKRESERVCVIMLCNRCFGIRGMLHYILYFMHVSLGLRSLSAKFGRILVSEC